MKKHTKLAVSVLLAMTLLAGCNGAAVVNKENTDDNTKNNIETVEDSVYDKEKEDNQEDVNKKDEPNSEANKNNEKKEINLEEVKPNEAGQVMIIMYHALGDVEKDYVRTVENFKADLELLYEKGYRPIGLKDFLNNEIDVEAGKTPVVLTFDDGNQTDFNIIEENEEKKIDPNSAIGILEDFNKKHPDFDVKATFFLNGGSNVFGQKELVEYKLNYIIENGMEIGTHTYGHENLTSISANNLQRTLARNVDFLKKYLPDYDMNVLALPFGSRPKNEELRKFLFDGSYEGTKYHNIGALAVGWRPEKPSIHKDFNPKYINRVHGSSAKFGMRFWLEDFDNKPSKRYISDGDKDTITIPEDYVDKIDKNQLKDKKLRTY